MRSDMAYAAVNGLNMYYEVHGAGPPLLSLHGGSGSINPASTVIPFFATQFQMIAIEQMGHGRTADLLDRPFHYHDMAEDTVELMRQLGSRAPPFSATAMAGSSASTWRSITRSA